MSNQCLTATLKSVAAPLGVKFLDEYNDGTGYVSAMKGE